MNLAVFKRSDKLSPPIPSRNEIYDLKPGDIVRLGKMAGKHGISYFEITIAYAHLFRSGWTYESKCGIEFRPENIREILETK